MLANGEPMSASLFDFALYLFHNASELKARGTAPYFYLPKLESHKEARLWSEVFKFSENYLNMTPGTIRATVLIETLPAAFEMDEILFELKEHSAGLNCGRWDYIFSFIKKFSHLKSKVLPDRSQVTMDKHFLKSYVELLIQTCHRREIHAMGGMAAQIPIKNDPEANDKALDRVRQDKLREVRAGHDGTWVAHPGLIPVAMEVFDANMPAPNQISKKTTAQVTAADLMEPTAGDITQAGLELNIDVGIQYLEAWLKGNGCVPIYNLMEDAATAEISRAQLWQWAHHGALMKDGSEVTVDRVVKTIPPVLNKIRNYVGEQRYNGGAYEQAARLFAQMTQRDEFPEFLTTVAYAEID
jgi:malate synthase